MKKDDGKIEKNDGEVSNEALKNKLKEKNREMERLEREKTVNIKETVVKKKK